MLDIRYEDIICGYNNMDKYISTAMNGPLRFFDAVLQKSQFADVFRCYCGTVTYHCGDFFSYPTLNARMSGQIIQCVQESVGRLQQKVARWYIVNTISRKCIVKLE